MTSCNHDSISTKKILDKEVSYCYMCGMGATVRDNAILAAASLLQFSEKPDEYFRLQEAGVYVATALGQAESFGAISGRCSE